QLKDKSILSLFAGGMEVDCVKYYDNQGSPDVSSDLVAAPFGPALVLKPRAPLKPNTEYTIKLTSAAIKDRAGNASDAMAEYKFTTEALFVLASTPDLSSTPDVAPNDVLVLNTNAAFDPATVTNDAVIVTDMMGNRIPVLAWADVGTSST